MNKRFNIGTDNPNFRTGKTIDIGQYTHGKGGSSEEKRSGPMAAPCCRQGKL